MIEKYFYQSDLKNNFEKEVNHNKNLSEKEKNSLFQILYEVTKEYELAKILIKQSVAYSGEEYEYFNSGDYLKFHRRDDFARYVFRYSYFFKRITSDLPINTEYGKAIYKLMELATEALVDYAKSGVFMDITMTGLTKQKVF